MKTNLLISIATIACLGIYSCEEDYNPPPIPTTKTSCISVIDASTNQPLDAALVQMTLRYKDSDTTAHDVDFQANTDATGNSCVTYDKGPSKSYLLSVSKPGYVTYTLGDSVNWFYIDQDIEVKLLPAADIRFHVKNEAPNLPDDYFFIVIPNDYGLVADTVLLSGSNVDTTWVKTVSIGYHNLKWGYYDDLEGNITEDERYFFEWNTTTDIEILY